MSNTDRVDGGLSAELGRFVLLSYASGATVEGEWRFVDTDRMVPDFVAVVTRVDDRPSTVRKPSEEAVGLRDPGRFKERFYDLLLEEYGRGTDVSGWYRLTYAAPELPHWIVRIETVGREPDVDRDRLHRTF